MIVFYTGPKKWKGPLTLSDYLDIPEELKEYVNDWKIKAVDVKEIDTSKIKDEQTRYFLEAIQEMYKGNFEGLHRRIKMNRDNFIYAAIITGSLDLIRDLPEGICVREWKEWQKDLEMKVEMKENLKKREVH